MLGSALALLLFSRTRQGQQALEGAAVTAGKIGSAIASAGNWLAKVPADLADLFASASAQHGLPFAMLEAVAYRESRFRQDIITGALRSSAGAVGVMQIIPRWHPDLGEAGALDPKRAIPYAAKYLRQLRDQFGAWDLALAAYNWGPGNLRKWQTNGGNWPTETQIYVAEITRNAGMA